MIRELIKDLDREDVLDIIKNCVAWAGLFFIMFMLSVICG